MATGFTFGAPRPSVPGGGFSLGTSPAATLGAPQPGSITFGTPVGLTNPTPAPQFGNPAPQFGTTAPQFGTQAPQFGTPAPQFGTPAPQFGTPASQFGTPATLNFSTITSAAPSFNFNAPASAPSLNFKSPAPTGLTPAPAGLSFAAPAPTGAINFNLGSTALATGGLNFGAPVSTPGLTLGAPSAAAGTGLFGSLTAKPATNPIALNFGSTATPSLNFGALATSIPQPTLNFGLGSAASSTPLSFGTTLAKPAATTSAPPIGLGGIATTLAKSGVPTSTNQSETPPKDTALPNEILQTVEHFKTYVKDQKTICSDIARYSCKDFETVHTEIASILSILTEVENELQKNRKLAEKLKYDTARGLQHAEMAQRTHDTPPGLQYDNVAPLYYFIELVNGFEKTLQALKMQVEITEKHVKSRGHAVALTPQELTIGMRRLHETFVALAGRLQSVHTQVESQKKEYLNLRKYLLGDASNVFEVATKESVALEVAVKSISTPPRIAPGPTPFSSFGGPFVANTAPPAYPASGSSAMGLSNSQGGNLSRGAAEYPYNRGKPTQGGFLFSSPESSSFQLQKPPAGNKRGKH